MTIVYCWLDQSLSRERIAAVADSRVSEQVDGVWAPLQEETIKLFRVPVRCYSMDTFDCDSGTWKAPYFETEVGLAFAGDCFEALSIFNTFQRVVAQLVVDGQDRPYPSPKGLYGALREAGQAWLSTYKRAKPVVQFLLFGYSPLDGKPWVGRLKWPDGTGIDGDQFEEPIQPSSLFFIGAEGTPGGAARAQRLRALFLKKSGSLNIAELTKAGFEPNLERAKILNADRMKLEEDLASLLLSDSQATIGGVMQEIEVFRETQNRAVVSFSRDDTPYADSFGEVAPKLAYRSVVSAMGFKSRPRSPE